MNSQEMLKTMRPEHRFFVGIDSDGCVFDTMELKHKECFCPNFIRFWDFQAVSKYAREVWEFVNLYSSTRGCNRFKALIYAFERIVERPEILERGVKPADISALIDWVDKEPVLSESTLADYAKNSLDPILMNAWSWSRAVNKSIQEMVGHVKPFPFVVDTLEKLNPCTDMMVVSQTPQDAIRREWKSCGIEQYVRLIAGQESGSKVDHLKLAAKGKYQDDRILMVGDAPGDLAAARKNNVLFYPIVPGHEEMSWERFHAEAVSRFLDGTYRGEYEQSLVTEFNKSLPELPPWKQIKDGVLCLV